MLSPSIRPKSDLGIFSVTVVPFKDTFRPLNSINFNSVFFLAIVDRLNFLKLKQYWVFVNHKLHGIAVVSYRMPYILHDSTVDNMKR